MSMRTGKSEILFLQKNLQMIFLKHTPTRLYLGAKLVTEEQVLVFIQKTN